MAVWTRCGNLSILNFDTAMSDTIIDENTWKQKKLRFKISHFICKYSIRIFILKSSKKLLRSIDFVRSTLK